MIVGPILLRELLTTPRRPRHFIVRAVYLALFFVLMWTAWQSIIGFQRVQRLGDLAYFNGVLFPLLSYTQLTLALFAGSLYGTSSISYEKDRRTFILLLITRLQDSEIVINKFLCGLLQVTTAMVAALPVFLIVSLLGGVSFDQIAQIYAITFGTALVSISFGVLIAVWRDKTFQAVAMTILGIVLALTMVEVLARVGGSEELFGLPISTWCACLSPFRAIAEVLEHRTVILPYLGRVSWACLAISTTATIAYLVISTVWLRTWNPRGEPIQQREAPEDDPTLTPQQRDERIFRRVWENPILWREIRTRAYGTKPLIIKFAYGIVFAILLALLLTGDIDPEARNVHQVVGLAMLPIAVLSLLLINAQSNAAITSERDLKSLDLLLVTDVTPREFIYGKLLGILYNTKEMVIAPFAFLAICSFMEWISIQGLIFTTISMAIFILFAAVLGIHAALRFESTKVSLANSLGTMFLLFVGIVICWYLIVLSGGNVQAQFASFILFIVLGSIALWVSLSANAPSGAISLTSAITPVATFYCLIAFVLGEQTGPFLVGAGVYAFAILALLIPLLAEFDVATGRTTAEEG